MDKIPNINHDSKEKIEFLKNEYGTGGRSPALSGASGSSENHDYKGIKYQKKNCEDITLTWEKVSKRIDELISKEIYKNEEEESENPNRCCRQYLFTGYCRRGLGKRASRLCINGSERFS